MGGDAAIAVSPGLGLDVVVENRGTDGWLESTSSHDSSRLLVATQVELTVTGAVTFPGLVWLAKLQKRLASACRAGF